MNERKLSALVQRAQAGDSQAFESLYVEHARSILFHVRSLIVDKQNYRDVAQDVALEMHRDIGKLRDPAAFRGWMHQVVRTTCADHNRKQITEQQRSYAEDSEDILAAVEDTSPDTSPEATFMAMVSSKALFEQINELPTAYREALVLRYYDDLSYKDIAKVQNISVSTVGSNIKRAIDILKTKLAADHEEEKSEVREMSRLANQDGLGSGFGSGSGAIGSAEAEASISASKAGVVTGTASAALVAIDDAGIAQSLNAGIAEMIPQHTINEVALQLHSNLASAAQLVGSGQATVSGGVGSGMLQGVVAACVCASLVLGVSGVVVSGGLPGQSTNQSGQNAPVELAIYEGAAHIEFTDATGGSANTDVVAIKVVEDEGSANAITWEVKDVSGLVVLSGNGGEVSAAQLAQLPVGEYKASFDLSAANGAQANASRSFYYGQKLTP